MNNKLEESTISLYIEKENQNDIESINTLGYIYLVGYGVE